MEMAPTIHAEITFEAIGTHWSIEFFAAIDARKRTRLLQKIRARIAVFDANYSRFRDDSLITTMAQRAGTYTLPADARPMFDLYKKLYDLTDGLMTPLIGQALVDAGYDAQYSLEPKTMHVVPKWEERLEYNFPKLTVKMPTQLDFGAAGKGYLVDIIAKLLTAADVHAFCVNAGGDMWYQNTTDAPLAVALENPFDPSQAIGVATLPPQTALCGSASNRRNWGKFHHIIDPKKLESPDEISGLWVTAGSCLAADALTTALFFASATTLLGYFDFEYAQITTIGQLHYSQKFPAEFFTQQAY